MIQSVTEALINRNPVKAALLLTKKYSEEDVVKATEKSETWRDLQKKLFPIESVGLEKVSVRLSHQVVDMNDLEKIAKYPTFSLVPLTWRNKEGWPKLAIFGLNSPLCSLGVIASHNIYASRWDYKETSTPDLRQLKSCYTDVFVKLRALSKELRKSVSISCGYSGVFPSDVRERVIAARNEFRALFLVAQAPPVWEVKRKNARIIKPADPLVIGLDSKGTAWLVASFDVTPLEDFILGNFVL